MLSIVSPSFFLSTPDDLWRLPTLQVGECFEMPLKLAVSVGYRVCKENLVLTMLKLVLECQAVVHYSESMIMVSDTYYRVLSALIPWAAGDFE